MKNLKCKVLALCMGASVFMCGKVFSQVPSYVPSNGLVGWWPFNGNANDESGNGNNGTVNGAILTTDRNGVANKAFSFDGISNEISIPSSNQLNTLPITISAWFKTSSSSEIAPIVNKYPCFSYNGYSLHLRNGQASVFYCGSNSNVSSNYLIYDPISSSTFINDNTWHNLTYSVDQTGVIYYLDGTSIFSGLFNNGIGMATNTIEPLHFGMYPNGACSNTFFFEGNIDDIGIWNRALTQEEITNLYNGCSASTITSQPTNQTVNPTTSAQFVVNATSGTSFQWQTDLGLGFQNLSNAGQYSGANNDTLVVSNASISNNNQQFRCIVNNAGCVDTSDIAVLTVSTAGMNELSVQGNVSLYPNPTQSSFEIQTNLVYSKIEIRDMQGRIVKTENAGKTITIASLQKGTYLVQLLDEKSKVIAVQQIIKE